MSKQKILLIALALILLVSVVAGFAYFFNKKSRIQNNVGAGLNVTYTEDSNKENAFNEFKKVICDNRNLPLDVKTINEKIESFSAGRNTDDQAQKNDFSYLKGYYFCNGLINNNPEEACANKFRSTELINQCKSSFYFYKTILASLNGDKEKARELCVNHMGKSALCDYIGSFDDVKKNNACSKLPEKEKSVCSAIFNGDDSLCKGSENEVSCFLAAKFIKIINEKNEAKCDDLYSSNPIDNYDIVCKIYLTKEQNVCAEYKYKKFVESFCAE